MKGLTSQLGSSEIIFCLIVASIFPDSVDAQLREVKADSSIVAAVKMYVDSVDIRKDDFGIIAVNFTESHLYSVDSTGRAKRDFYAIFSITSTDSQAYVMFLQPYEFFYYNRRPVVITSSIETVFQHDAQYSRRIGKQFGKHLRNDVVPSEGRTLWFSLVNGEVKIESDDK